MERMHRAISAHHSRQGTSHQQELTKPRKRKGTTLKGRRRRGASANGRRRSEKPPQLRSRKKKKKKNKGKRRSKGRSKLTSTVEEEWPKDEVLVVDEVFA